MAKKLRYSTGRFRMERPSFSMVSQSTRVKDIKEKARGGYVFKLEELDGFSVDDLDVEDEFEPVVVQVSGWWIVWV